MQFNHVAGKSNVNVNMYNGTIEIASRALVNLLNQTSTEASRQDLNLTFKNIMFCYKEGTSHYQYLINATDNAAGFCVANITFDECIINLTNYGNTKAYNLVVANADANSSHVIHVVVKGGEYIIDSDVTYNLISDRKTGYPDGESDTLKFEKDSSGIYTKFTMPISLSAPANIYDSNTNISYAIISSDGTNATYTLGENVSTKYGDIPFAYADASNYPFVLFQYGKFIESYATWNDFNIAIGKLNNTEEDAKTVILVRDDFETSTSSATFHNVKYLTIDLGGNKITGTKGKLFNLSCVGDFAFESNLTIKNGTLSSSHVSNPPITFNSSNKTNVSAKFNVIFEGVTFDSESTSGGNLVLVAFSNGTGGCIYEMNFNDCIFDATKGNITSLFGMADASGNKFDVHVTVNGGKLIANKYFDFATFSPEITVGAGSPDSLTFGNKTFTVILPKDAAAPSLSASYVTVAGAECVFVKSSENGDFASYSLYPSVMVGYKIKSSVTLYSNFVYNIYVPATNAVSAVYIEGEPVVLDESMITEIDGVNYYRIQLSLPASKSLMDIKLAVALKSGETTVNAKWTLNIVNYAKTVISGDSSEVEKALIRDMLSYAAAAHTYFKTTENVADKLAEIANILGEDYDTNNKVTVPEDAAKKPTDDTYFKSVSIYLGEVPSFRFYLASGYEASDFTFTVGGKKVEAIAIDTNSDGIADCLEIAMYAYMMLDDVSYTVINKDTNAAVTEYYNLYAYYKYVNSLTGDDSDVNLVSIVERLMKYAASADAYRDSVTNE